MEAQPGGPPEREEVREGRRLLGLLRGEGSQDVEAVGGRMEVEDVGEEVPAGEDFEVRGNWFGARLLERRQDFDVSLSLLVPSREIN